jgi:hypothetical protein
MMLASRKTLPDQLSLITDSLGVLIQGLAMAEEVQLSTVSVLSHFLRPDSDEFWLDASFKPPPRMCHIGGLEAAS